MAKLTLTEYRALIREDWAALVGRRRFSSHEYPLTKDWYDAGIPVASVLEAIRRVRSRGRPVHSLGVITADLAAVQRERAQGRVGESRVPKAESWTGGGREAFLEMLDELAGREGIEPRCKALIDGLKAELPTLGHNRALARLGEIQRCMFTKTLEDSK